MLVKAHVTTKLRLSLVWRVRRPQGESLASFLFSVSGCGLRCDTGRRLRQTTLCATRARSQRCSLALLVDEVAVVDGPDPADEDEAENPHEEHGDNAGLDGLSSSEDTSEGSAVAGSEDVQNEANNAEAAVDLHDGIVVILLKGVHNVSCFRFLSSN